jgi:hypothetical protein
MTKMTDEDLEQVRSIPALTATERRLLAHIAALTAERDEARKEREQFRGDLVRASEFAHQGGTGSPVTQEGRDAIESIGGLWNKADALRERVKALEAENTQHRTWREVAEARAAQAERARDRAKEAVEQRHRQVLDAESRLAAIRQRAGALVRDAGRPDALPETTNEHGERMVRVQWALVEALRDVLGDDAPPSEMDGLRGEMAERICEHDVVPCTTCHPPASPEPTTAEACATVRAWVEDKTHRAPESWRAATEALSLLERRMGAIVDAARELLETTGDPRYEPDVFVQLRAALTDAPPVFTLEEVRNAGEVVADDVEPGPVALTDDAAEAYASGWARGARTVADRIPTLRK